MTCLNTSLVGHGHKPMDMDTQHVHASGHALLLRTCLIVPRKRAKGLIVCGHAWMVAIMLTLSECFKPGLTRTSMEPPQCLAYLFKLTDCMRIHCNSYYQIVQNKWLCV